MAPRDTTLSGETKVKLSVLGVLLGGVTWLTAMRAEVMAHGRGLEEMKAEVRKLDEVDRKLDRIAVELEYIRRTQDEILEDQKKWNRARTSPPQSRPSP